MILLNDFLGNMKESLMVYINLNHGVGSSDHFEIIIW